MMDYSLDRFPVRSGLRDGSPCSIRLLEKKDEATFRGFHKSIPEREQLFIRRQIEDGSLFQEWISDPEYSLNLPLLAFIDGEIAAMGILQTRPAGWKRHIGKVSFLTHPDFHGIGLIDFLLEQIVQSARNAGLIRLESEINGERETAVKAMAMAGFTELLRLPNYIQDMKAETHDYVMMGMELIAPFEYLGAGD